MKKMIVILCASVAIAACTSNSNSGNTEDTVTAGDHAAAARQSEVDTSINNTGTNRSSGAEPAGAYEKGAQLISSSDCLTCHKVDQKIVGPSYKEVAQKYEANEANVSYLAGKIIKGGSGVWGEIPMTPHPTLSEDDAKEMANYILSLK